MILNNFLQTSGYLFNPIQHRLFRGFSRIGEGGGQKEPPSLKSVTHILQ